MNGKIRHLTASGYITSEWSGGETTQLAIFPETASYKDRQFLWRISSATVNTEESDFTVLPGYDRFLTVLTGSIRLSHENQPSFSLRPYEIYRFDGGAHTHSQGICRDFNLMLQKGRSKGRLYALSISPGGEEVLRLKEPQSGCLAHFLLYCAAGNGVLLSDGARTPFSAGETILLEFHDCQTLLLSAGERDSVFLAAEIETRKEGLE